MGVIPIVRSPEPIPEGLLVWAYMARASEGHHGVGTLVLMAMR